MAQIEDLMTKYFERDFPDLIGLIAERKYTDNGIEIKLNSGRKYFYNIEEVTLHVGRE